MILTEAATRLKEICDEAYDKFPNFCNQSTKYVLEKLVDPACPLEEANRMIDRIVSAGWKEIDDDTAWTLANAGTVVVCGLKSTTGEGHVLVVYPGDRKMRGGFTCAGTNYPEVGEFFPRSMSTSSAAWCGTRSKGDKTIRDAWSATDWPGVKRWRKL